MTEATSGRRVGRHMTRQVDELRGHFVLCGYGRVGSTVAHELVHDGKPFVVIDVNPASLERARADGHLVVEGDATDDATLRAVGIERAHGLVSTIDSDAQNVYVILSARAINRASSSSAGPARRPPRRSWPWPGPTGSSRPTRWPAGAWPSSRSGRASSTSSTPRFRTVSSRSASRSSTSRPTGGSRGSRSPGSGARDLRARHPHRRRPLCGQSAGRPPLAAGETIIASGSAEALAAARADPDDGGRPAGPGPG